MFIFLKILAQNIKYFIYYYKAHVSDESFFEKYADDYNFWTYSLRPIAQKSGCPMMCRV